MTRLPITSALSVNLHVILDPAMQHYVRTVLRLAEGANLVLFNGDGRDYHAVVQVVNKKSVILKVMGCEDNDTESPLTVTLLQGIAKGERMDFVMQKATELGVTNIVPVVTEFCAVKQTANYRVKKPPHWQSVANFAAAQSGRAVIPTVAAPMPLADALMSLADETFAMKWALSPTGQQVSAELRENEDSPHVCVLVGPEGGLSVTDLALARQHGFTTVRLGARVLRSETAAMTVLAVLQSHLGDF